MADLGNLNDSLRLKCKRCEYLPPDSAKMEAVQLHCQVEHDTDKVELDLVPVCSCGTAMEHTGSGQFKDYFKCAACGNTGHVKRDAKPFGGREQASRG
jgi:hypothetical protein